MVFKMFSKTTVEVLKNRTSFESLQLTFSWLDQEMVCGGGGSSGYRRGLSQAWWGEILGAGATAVSQLVFHNGMTVITYTFFVLVTDLSTCTWPVIFEHLTCSSKNSTMKKVLWLSLILQENFNKVFKS